MVAGLFVPQSYAWGVEAQVDWYEAYADLGGERTKLQVFSMRSMASGAAFHCAFLHATQQAFLEAHELAFAYYWRSVSETALRQPDFCGEEDPAGTPAGGNGAIHRFPLALAVRERVLQSGRGHEKGGVEGEAGYFRRNHWVPVPQAADLAELNRQLLAACREDEQRRIGRTRAERWRRHW